MMHFLQKKSFAIANICFEFEFPQSVPGKKKKQPKEQKHPRGVVEGSCRQTRALAAHMNGVRGDPCTVSLSVVANDNGHTGRAADMSCDAESWMPTGCTGPRP